MFDLTPGIKLDEKELRLYQIFRLALYSAFTLLAFFAAYKILFPEREFVFSFGEPNSSRNTIIEVRLDGEEIEKRSPVFDFEKLNFESSLAGEFSQIKAEITLEKGSAPIEDGGLAVRKSYRSHFYPEGRPIGFPDGALIKKDGDHFIVSEGKTRKFSSLQTIGDWGLTIGSFLSVTEEDMTHNPSGEIIPPGADPVEGTFFEIDDNFYQLRGGELRPFVSRNAFLTHAEDSLAAEAAAGIFEKFPIAEEYLGFRSGSLIAAGISAYVVEGNMLHPINNPATFESMGYAWKDLIEADSEEIGIYEKERLLTIAGTHPDGTVLFEKETGRYYYVEGGKKRPVPTASILSSYLRADPVAVEGGSLSSFDECRLEKGLIFKNRYVCLISLDNSGNNLGKDFEFRSTGSGVVRIKKITLTFGQKTNRGNLLKSLGSIKNRLLIHYKLAFAPGQTLDPPGTAASCGASNRFVIRASAKGGQAARKLKIAFISLASLDNKII